MPAIRPWVERELRTLELGDQRRHQRAKTLLSAMALAPEASIPEACGSQKDTKAAYRLLSSPIEPKSLREAHADATVERIAGRRRVLALQDTTSLDFTCCPGTEGLGPLDSPLCRGLKVQTTLVVEENGTPLGI